MSGSRDTSRSDGQQPEQDLDDVVATYVDLLNSGESVDPETVLDEHPELGLDILTRLEAFMGAETQGDMTTPLGTLGDYTLRRQIGRGGMGVVYEAWQNSVERSVALKVLPAGVAVDERSLQRFVREAKTAAQLDHPNVVGVHGMGLEKDTPYYAMEYVEGETLAQVLGRLKEAEEGAETVFGKKDRAGYFEELAEAFADVADGLQHAHSKGVVHRDIKPSNLILDAEADRGGRAKPERSGGRPLRLRILDFGLARLEGQESLTISGDVLGTPAYMSPEQARRRKIPIDHRTDVYSLGATLYELLTQEQPFRGKDHNDTLSQIVERDPRPPRQSNGRIPQDLETIVLKCLRKDAGDRYRTAEALGQDLRRFVRGDPVEARREARWERCVRRLSEERGKLLAGSLLLLFSLVTVWLTFARWHAEEERNRLAYEPAVRRAALKIFASRLGFDAGAGSFDRLLRRGDTSSFPNPLLADDFLRLTEGFGRKTVEDAVKELNDAIVAVPERHDGHYHLAQAHLLLGDREAALQSIRRSLERHRGFVPARRLELELTATTDDELATALSTLGEEYAASGGWEEGWLFARQSVEGRRWPEAARAYAALVAERGDDPEPYAGFWIDAYMGEGLAWLQARNLIDAQKAFYAACALAPRAAEPRLFLAKAYHRSDRPDAAAAELERLYQQSGPDEREEMFRWGAAVYFSLQDYRRAHAWLNEHPLDGKLKARLQILALLRLGHRNEAIQLGRRVYAEDSGDPVALLAFAQALVEEAALRADRPSPDEVDEMVAVLTKATSLAEDLPASRSLLKAVKREWGEGRPAEALPVGFTVQEATASGGTPRSGRFSGTTSLVELNSPLPDNCIALSSDEREVFFASSRPGGAGSTDIWRATRKSPSDTFGDLHNVEELNTEADDYPWSLSQDGLTLYFDSNRFGGEGHFDLYASTRPTATAAFGSPRPLSEVNSRLEEIEPAVTADGLELYFTRGRGNFDSRDLYVSLRSDPREPFSTPRPLDELNTKRLLESEPVISSDGLTLFFASPRSGGVCSTDVWVATRKRRFDATGAREPFEPPALVSRPVSSCFIEAPAALSTDWPADGSALYFFRRFENQTDNDDLYRATWHAEGGE